jgi:TetR/AcrR family transcriptional regulator
MAAPRRSTSALSTRDAVFAAAARLFSSRGFDGVSMDGLARDAGVNKAMIYYHFAGKLALYRSIVGEGLQAMSETTGTIAASADPAPQQLDRFIEAFVHMTEQRPWMPAMMLREIAEGAPRLDPGTMNHMRGIITGFAAILERGQQAGLFRQVHPILAYEWIVGPIIVNAARERVAAQPARKQQGFPMLVEISHQQLIAHGQEAARRMLATEAATSGPQKARKA